jgi:hypothetical protein
VSWSLLAERAYAREVLEVRGRAAEILAAVGRDRLQRIALFRANRWAEASTANHERDARLADLNWIRSAEWLRIWLTLDTSEN